jgi:regulator of extracellular matrix RemA (YlzA/DUF370 family)
MNKRIKQLAEQAGSVADATYAKGPDAIWLREYNKKFAELIVQECLAQVFCDSEDEYRITDSIYERIEKHFGVEE